MIQQGMEDWQIPGLSTIVVKDGEVVFHKSYGVKNLEAKEAVDGNTLFTMASTTKALIAISMGILVDRGELDWDDKVREHYPEFKLADSYITDDARVKDLLTHNLGMGDADLLWIFDSVSTKETLDRFQLVEPSYPLRGGYTYQNLMYVIAGELIGEVSGTHWTTFVEENILDPLEMRRTQTKATGIFEAGNYATPYFNDIEDGIVEVGYTLTDQMGAAGMMWTCTNDIANYLAFLDAGGVYKGDTLLKPETFARLFQPHTIIPQSSFYPTTALTKPEWTTYGLGWFQHDYRGEKLDFHTGSIWGLVAIAGIIHDQNTAVYVVANMDHAELRHAIMYKALDLYAFDDDSRDWHTEVFDLYSGFRERAKEQLRKRDSARVAGTNPTLPLADYTGTYVHPVWGSMIITVENDNLKGVLNGRLTFTYEHWHYDTFITNKDPQLRSRLTTTFNIGSDGQVRSMGEGDLVFVRT